MEMALTTTGLVWWQRHALEQENDRRLGQTPGSIRADCPIVTRDSHNALPKH